MSSEAAQKAGGGAMSTRDELESTIDEVEGRWDDLDAIGKPPGSVMPSFERMLADALIAEGWRKVPDRDEIAAVIANHFITRGQQVASGVTCECGYWTGNEPEAGKRPLNWGRDRLGLHRADLVLALMDRGQ